MRREWTLYVKTLKSNKRCWYVRFWCDSQKKYVKTKTTGVEVVGKKGRVIQAREVAQKLYQEYIQEKTNAHQQNFLEYLYEFWQPDSEYCKYKEHLRGVPLTSGYIQNCQTRIRKHVSGFTIFQNMKLSDLTRGMFQDWMKWALAKGVGAYTINDTLDAMSVALEWKKQREELQRNPIKGIGRFKENSKEKGILTEDEIKNLINVNESVPRVKLACLLSLLGGLRLGETRGLRWGDLDFKNEIITIKHNFVDLEGPKSTKNCTIRYIPLFPEFKTLLEDIKIIQCGEIKPTDFVLFNSSRKDKPIHKKSIYEGFKRILNKIGIPEEDRVSRNITFHSLRHTFVSEAYKRGLSKFEVKALAGHLTDEMSQHYTHEAQAISIEQMKRKLFA